MGWISSLLGLSFLMSLRAVQAASLEANEVYGTSVIEMCASMCWKFYNDGHQHSETSRSACRLGCELVCHLQMGAPQPEFHSSLEFYLAKRTCRKDCSRIYGSQKERVACNLGCSCKLIPPPSASSPVFWFPQNADEIEPDDVLLDPVLRTQLKKREAPLPHLHIKTLPRQHAVEELYQFKEVDPFAHDQSDTFARFWDEYVVDPESNTTRIIIAAIILLVICALLLCLLPDQKHSQSNSMAQIHNSLSYQINPDLIKDLSVKNTKDKSEPPMYSDCVLLSGAWTFISTDIHPHPPTIGLELPSVLCSELMADVSGVDV